jgi:hypothetical protein
VVAHDAKRRRAGHSRSRQARSHTDGGGNGRSASRARRLITIEGVTMRRSALLVTIASTLAAGAIFAVTAAGGSPTAKTIRLYEHDTSQASVDLGAAGESEGDLFVFAGDTFKHKGGAKVGRAAGTCTTVSTGPAGESLCVINFSLKGGQISAQGLALTAEEFGGKTVSFPITGGTGKYRKAHGQGTVQVPQDVPNLADANFVLRLR